MNDQASQEGIKEAINPAFEDNEPYSGAIHLHQASIKYPAQRESNHQPEHPFNQDQVFIVPPQEVADKESLTHQQDEGVWMPPQDKGIAPRYDCSNRAPPSPVEPEEQKYGHTAKDKIYTEKEREMEIVSCKARYQE